MILKGKKNTAKEVEYIISEDSPVSDIFRKNNSLQSFPEKIMQFGTGSLFLKIKSLGIDFGIDDENGYGRVVVGTSKANYSASRLKKDDNTISRLLFEKEQWPEILACATNPDLKVIIINKRIVRKDVLKDNINDVPPFSLPGKLLALLFNRFKYFDGEIKRGLIIVSADQDHNSPEIVESIILELAHLNNLDPYFLDWIENSNQFYCSYT